MITLDHISKSFAHTRAVRDVSAEMKTGEIIGLLGPNGAGKTTTMRMIMGLTRADKGKITVDGYDPASSRLDVVGKIGYLPENNPLYLDMKVNEYLTMIAKIKSDTSTDLRDLTEQVGLTEVFFKKIESLSRGYKQRVGLAAALLGDPRILILDEPTSGLDPIEQDTIKSLIRSLAKEKLVLFSTHILSEVEDIATRLVIIHKGSVVYDGAKPKGSGAVESLFKKLVSHE